jgi:ribosome maturation factor RimP
MTDISTIVDAVSPLVAARGLELYDVEVHGTGSARVLRVLVTTSAGSSGLDLDAIAACTEAISPVLDEPPVATSIQGPYALEVSSPGLERPLRTAEHFRGAIGELISVKHGDTGRERGTILSADDTGFELEGSDGTTHRVAYDDVVKARTVFEWGETASRRRPASSGKARR